MKCGKMLPTFWDILLPPTSNHSGDEKEHKFTDVSEETYCFHLQRRRISQDRAAFSVAVYFSLVAYLIFRHRRWRHNVAPKRRYYIASHTITAVMTSIPTYHDQVCDTPWKATQCEAPLQTLQYYWKSILIRAIEDHMFVQEVNIM